MRENQSFVAYLQLWGAKEPLQNPSWMLVLNHQDGIRGGKTSHSGRSDEFF
jgi:hypothetical protein